MNVLVFNVGSTTLKYACVDAANGMTSEIGLADRIGRPDGDAATHLAAAEDVIDRVGWDKIDAIGHRIVQGGSRFAGPTLVSSNVLDELKNLDSLAPLHNPAARQVAEGLVDIGRPQVLVFDTSYFASLQPAAYRYAVPDSWYREYGVRRYGFHGTSHEYVTKRALQELGNNATGRCISLHLGGGASVAASLGGVAVDTSMGMTPLQGLVMATRSGDLDPAIPLYLIEAAGASAKEVETALNRKSGLVGLCGDSDMRTILKRRTSGDADASLAIDIYVRTVIKAIGSYFAILGGLDALIFTAGVGEHSSEIRKLVCEALGHFGVAISTDANLACAGELSDISADASQVRTLVIATNEELAIARQVCNTLQS